MFIVFLALTKTRQADQFVTRNSSLDLRTLSFIFYSNWTSEIIFFYAFVLFNQGLAHFDFSFFICFIYNFTSFLFIYFMWLTFFLFFVWFCVCLCLTTIFLLAFDALARAESLSQNRYVVPVDDCDPLFLSLCSFLNKISSQKFCAF